MAGEKYNGEGKFNWTPETMPKFNMPQCNKCIHNEVVGDRVECEVFGYPRPIRYEENEAECPQKILKDSK